jgi:glycosyltransferase involved in cell wall biosynthesis
MRVAYVLPWPTIGGGEISTLRLAQAMARDRNISPLAFCHDHSDVARAFRDSAFQTHSIEGREYSYRSPWPYVRSTVRLARALRRERVDLVHCSDLMAAYYAAPAARLASVPVLCHIRSNFPDQIPRRHTVPIMAVNYFAFVSRAAWRNFDRIFRVPDDRGTVVHNFAPLPSKPALDPLSRQRLRRKLGLSEDAPVVAMFARIAPQKDFEVLIEAFSRVVARRPDARLLLVGEYGQPADCHAYWRALCDRIQDFGLAEHVVWAGFRRDVSDLMYAVDVVALATHNEGFGLVLVEAMAHGRPVVATNVGGVPEIVDDGETGLLHEHGDADGLARSMLRLIEDPQLARTMGERGLRVVNSRFTEERTVTAIHQVYKRLVKTRLASVAAS